MAMGMIEFAAAPKVMRLRRHEIGVGYVKRELGRDQTLELGVRIQPASLKLSERHA